MKSLIAFTKKEWMHHLRSKKIMIFAILFIAVGAMNTAFAKLTPALLDMLSESLEETGMNLVITEITALDSWVQFYKNIPMVLIAFIVIESNIFTKEYSSGTLILSLTKGLERFKVVVSKTLMLVVLWTVGYWLCFATTYGCNMIFWDNSIAQNLIFSGVCWWLFGIWTISLMVIFSVIFSSNIGVMGLTGGVAFFCYLVSLLPKINKFSPAFLASGSQLVYGLEEPKTYIISIVITVVITVICLLASLKLFNKKQL